MVKLFCAYQNDIIKNFAVAVSAVIKRGWLYCVFVLTKAPGGVTIQKTYQKHFVTEFVL